ncbi:MAG: sodium:solute symporter [Bacteroidetes bacterium]|jgi:SSS family transporter|nr:sodium:solute symporter [Bacteroidota bacterium]
MSTLDWLVMLSTLLGIVAYGVWKTRKVDNVQSYLLGDRDLPWWTIGLSVMATQASAITFLSTPGQAYEDGMRFVQFYFGLPIAMVILCVFVLPIYYRLKVYTAYEYLEGRFDLRTRTLTAVLFLIQRGLAAGLTIYAPAIILSSILEWPLRLTILCIGVLVIFYTMLGGTKAVSVTQKQQMIVILSGMFIAAMILIFKLPADVSFGDAVGVAGKMGKLNVVDFEFDLSTRYNFWSGMLGGVFLFLSYFGTDQSQVQRYLSGKSLTESRLGLLFNGLLKVPMQFLVLFVGVLVFVFFQFQQPPIHFNSANLEKLEGTAYESELKQLQSQHNTLFITQEQEVKTLMQALETNNETAIERSQNRLAELRDTDNELRMATDTLILQAYPAAKVKDTDYVFITFVTEYLPIGLVGLLLAVIFSAAMSSTASELSALATTTVVDLYRRSWRTDKDDLHYLKASKAFTAVWGGVALVFASTANLFENLIQAVNIVGSLFYGTILGIFLVAFFMKKVGGRAVFYAALIGEAVVLVIFTLNTYGIIEIAYLWLNLIGCTLVMVLAWVLEQTGAAEPAP